MYTINFDAAGEPIGPVTTQSMTGIHQADFLGQQALAQIRAAVAAGEPFFSFVNPVMVHYGTCAGPILNISDYQDDDPFWELDLAARNGCTNASANENCNIQTSPCPTLRHAHAADNLTNPHVPSWNAEASGGVPAAMQRPPATAYENGRQDVAFRNRTASAMDLDDMLGVLLDGLDELGLTENTIICFLSDNGFHLAEHRLVSGKDHPYDTDVRVPLVIAGPGVAQNASRAHPVAIVDLTATLVDLFSAPPPANAPPLDGLSFSGALSAAPPPPAAWRNFSFSEHFGGEVTWWLLRRPLPGSGDEDAATTFTWWCTNQSEVFDLDADPWQLANLANNSARGAGVAQRALPLAAALARCSGSNCSFPQLPLRPPPADALACYKTSRVIVA